MHQRPDPLPRPQPTHRPAGWPLWRRLAGASVCAVACALPWVAVAQPGRSPAPSAHTLAAKATAVPTAHEAFGDKFLQLGTGSPGGAFRPVGESLCDTVNQDRRATLVRCVPVGTAGSTFNINAVAHGELQLGIAQEDLAARLHQDPASPHGRALRAVAVLHSSPIAVMAHRDAGIRTLAQLAGKRMNMGNRGSGQFSITSAILRALDLRTEDLGAVTYLPTAAFEDIFCQRRVDVVVEAVAHPSALFDKLLACGGVFIDIPAEVVARMAADNPFLAPMPIEARTYALQPQTVQTLGMRNLLVSHERVDAEAIARLTISLMRRQPELAARQPLLRSMQPLRPTALQSLPLPWHEGAARALNLPAPAAP